MKKHTKRFMSVLLAVLIMLCGVVPTLAATPKTTNGRRVISKMVKKSLDYSTWDLGSDTELNTTEIDYSWD